MRVFSWISFFCVSTTPVSQRLLTLDVPRPHRVRHILTSEDISAGVIGLSQSALPHNTQQSQETEVLTNGGILTRNTCKRATAGPPFRTSGLQFLYLVLLNKKYIFPMYRNFWIYIQWNLPKPDPLYTGNLDKRKINFGTELFPM